MRHSLLFSYLHIRYNEHVKSLIEKFKTDRILRITVIFTAAMILFHLLMSISFGDDTDYFGKILTGSTLPENAELLRQCLYTRYMAWSSRILIDAATIILCMCPVLWKILDVAVWFLIYWCLLHIGGIREKKLPASSVLILLLLFPFMSISRTGWISTSLNYLWPAAFGLYAVTVMKDALDGRNMPAWKVILLVPAMLFCANHEQACIYMTIVAAVFLALSIKEKRKSTASIIVLLICILSIVNIAVCPGNAIRSELSIPMYMPDFRTMSLFDRFMAGWTHLMNHLCEDTLPLFAVFTSMLACAVFQKSTLKKDRITALMPIAYEVLFLVLPDMQEPRKAIMPALNWISILISLIMVISIFVSLFRIYGIEQNGLMSYAILTAAGVCTAAMGFSPTLYISSERTFIWFYLTLILLSLLLLEKIAPPEKYRHSAMRFSCLVGAAGFIYTIARLIYLLRI